MNNFEKKKLVFEKKNLHKKPNLIYSYDRKRKAHNRNYNYEIEENVEVL